MKRISEWWDDLSAFWQAMITTIGIIAAVIIFSAIFINIIIASASGDFTYKTEQGSYGNATSCDSHFGGRLTCTTDDGKVIEVIEYERNK